MKSIEQKVFYEKNPFVKTGIYLDSIFTRIFLEDCSFQKYMSSLHDLNFITFGYIVHCVLCVEKSVMADCKIIVTSYYFRNVISR